MATWIEANARANKRPVVLVTVGTDRASTGVIQASTGAYTICVSKVGAVGGAVQPHSGRTQIRAGSFSLSDQDGAITAWLATDRRGATVTIALGYHDVDEADYLTIFRGIVTGYKWSAGEWSFQCQDLRRTVKKTVFTGASESSPVAISLENPIDIALRILTSTGAGTNGDYDDYAATNGLGIAAALVDVDGFELVRDDDFPSELWSFSEREPADALEWIEGEICKPLGIYLVTLASGALSCRKVKPPLLADDPISLDASNIVTISVDNDLSHLVNEVAWKWDYDPVDDEFDHESIYLDSTSLTAYGTSKVLEIESHSTYPSVSAAFVASRNSGVFARYSKPYPRIKVTANLSRNQIDEGTIVVLSHPNVPNLATGTRGVLPSSPLVCEVMSASVDVLGGKVSLDLLVTPWSYGKRYARIAPSGTPDATSATETQKRRYGFAGRSADNKINSGTEDGYLVYQG